jgi:hypothetical protein
VALPRVEVLVPEQLLHLAPARRSSGEDVAQRVRSGALALVHARCRHVVAEEVADLGVVERLALDADETTCSVNGVRVA